MCWPFPSPAPESGPVSSVQCTVGKFKEYGLEHFSLSFRVTREQCGHWARLALGWHWAGTGLARPLVTTSLIGSAPGPVLSSGHLAWQRGEQSSHLMPGVSRLYIIYINVWNYNRLHPFSQFFQTQKKIIFSCVTSNSAVQWGVFSSRHTRLAYCRNTIDQIFDFCDSYFVSACLILSQTMCVWMRVKRERSSSRVWRLDTRAGNEGPRSFYNHGEGPY